MGYAGGVIPEPTRKNMLDHTETVQLEYDPKTIAYQQLVRHFFQSHNPNRKPYRDREYISLILYHNERQKELAEKGKLQREEIVGSFLQTEISSYKDFTMAEDRQQKWHIKRNKKALEQLKQLFPKEECLMHSTIAARMNGLAKGFGSREVVKKEIENRNIDEKSKEELMTIINALD